MTDLTLNSEQKRLLQNVANDAIEYVGKANYRERSDHAEREIDRCWTAAKLGDWEDVVFRDEE